MKFRPGQKRRSDYVGQQGGGPFRAQDGCLSFQRPGTERPAGIPERIGKPESFFRCPDELFGRLFFQRGRESGKRIQGKLFQKFAQESDPAFRAVRRAHGVPSPRNLRKGFLPQWPEFVPEQFRFGHIFQRKALTGGIRKQSGLSPQNGLEGLVP
ncbi:hypothetical protein SDC9_194214 [bioreactor metagenome]|uniref:Uncharacterized protein n=1 Tax=bioreactor metagenome TaxID=1076179 RepID=A0A645IGY8_9ZZZZ